MSAPSKKGQIVYAASENVASYKDASINTPQFGGLKTKGNNGINWSSGAIIGTYTGVAKQAGGATWYQLEYVVYHRNRFLGIGNKYSLKPGGSAWNPKVYISYFRAEEISAEDVLTVDEQKKVDKEKEQEDLATLIKDVTEKDGVSTDTPSKGLFGSIFGPTIQEDGTVSNNNIGALVGIILILIVGILGVVFLRRKKAAGQSPAQVPSNIRVIEKDGKINLVDIKTKKIVSSWQQQQS